jgi:hypothetical protein
MAPISAKNGPSELDGNAEPGNRLEITAKARFAAKRPQKDKKKDHQKRWW